MSQENVDALREGYDAYNRGDLDTAFANFDENILWKGGSDLVPGGGEYQGVDQIRNEWLKEIAENFEEFSVTPSEFLDAGDHVVVLGRGHAKLKNGQTSDADVCHVWKYSGEKIVEGRFFGDSASILKAMEG
jgi:ketosteroid isomerase-like protein